LVLLFIRPAFGAATGKLSVEYVSLQAYPEADCTKIHVYLKNAGPYPVFLESVQFDERVLGLDPAKQAGYNSSHLPSKTHGDQGAPHKTEGNLQWCRALPNPLPPDGVADVAVSLWEIARVVPIRITARDGETLGCRASEASETLRLSQIAFDPAAPNKIYVYCENKTGKDIVVDHLLVNTEEVGISQSFPSGNVIQAGKKACFIVLPKRKMIWGQYVGVGIVGGNGQKIMAVVRVINYFPIGSWDADTRGRMFFDSTDLRKPMPDGSVATDDRLTVPLEGTLGRPFQAYHDDGNPFRVGASWEDNAKKIICTMAVLNEHDISTPFYASFGLPIIEAYAFFGGLPDLAFMSPYTILARATGPEESGRLIRLARTWIDPRPIVSIPEAFSNSVKIARDLTPDEVSFATWNEVAEGAKGVRYYHRHGSSPDRGYAEMPGVEARIACDALNLQLLKPFLRVGDTLDMAASSNGKVACKSILCGEKGIVVVALNRDFTGKLETPSEWRCLTNVGVSATIPSGQRVGQVLKVNQGFHSVPFTQNNNCVGFSIPSIRTVCLYLVMFQPQKETVRKSPAAQKSPVETGSIFNGRVSMNAEYVSTLLTDYKAQSFRIALPLLAPGVQLDDARTLGIGFELDAMRESVFRALVAIKEGLADLDVKKQESVRAALACACEVLGQDEEQ